MYGSILSGYHMNKKHWNTVVLDGSIPDEEIFTMIDDSYDLVVKKLKSSDQKRLNLKRASQ
ncbi:MAG: MmcQ/YjbR family DNA-binding protein [Pseudomonadota bacterium]